MARRAPVPAPRSFARSAPRRPGSASACGSRPTRSARPESRELLAEEGVDYLSLALGDSVHLPRLGRDRAAAAVEEAAIAGATGRFARRPPADRDLARGRRGGRRPAARRGPGRGARDDPRADRRPGAACQGSRRAGRGDRRLHRLQRLHRPLPRGHARCACAINPRTGRELRLAAPERRRAPRRLVVVGGGPAGIAAATEAGRAGHEVVLLERGETSRRPDRARRGRAGRRGARAPLPRQRRAAARRRPASRCASASRRARRASSRTQSSSRPARAPTRTSGSRSTARTYCRPGTCSRGQLPEGERIVVADWGGDPSGLDAAEVLAAAGKRGDAAVGVGRGRRSSSTSTGATSTCSGSTGRAWSPPPPPSSSRRTSGAVRLRNVFAPELVTEVEADALVLALGRVPARPRRSRRASLSSAAGRLPLAALARGGGARGHARGPRGPWHRVAAR